MSAGVFVFRRFCVFGHFSRAFVVFLCSVCVYWFCICWRLCVSVKAFVWVGVFAWAFVCGRLCSGVCVCWRLCVDVCVLLFFLCGSLYVLLFVCLDACARGVFMRMNLCVLAFLCGCLFVLAFVYVGV